MNQVRQLFLGVSVFLLFLYEVDANDTCIFEGDIVCPRADFWPGIFVSPLDKNRLWTTRTVPYFVDPVFDDFERGQIVAAINHLEAAACVKFEPLEERPLEKVVDYVHVQKKEGCYSEVGRVGGRQVLSLGEGCLTSTIFVAVHELMHTLGLWHEHNRPDRDEHLIIYQQHIKANMRGNFVKRPRTTTDLLDVPYDYRSIMHYGPYDYSVDPSLPTIWPKDSSVEASELGQRNQLSDLDVERLQRLYRCDITNCDDPGSPDGGSRDFEGGGGDFAVGSTVRFACGDDSDLILAGSQVRTCKFDAQWSGDEPACIQRNSWFCDFEDNECGTVQLDTQSNFAWTRRRGPTSKDKDTGPRVDMSTGTTSGHYFLASTSKRRSGMVARMSSPVFLVPVDQGIGHVCVSLGYYMWGDGVGALKVSYVDDNEHEEVLFVVTGNQGPKWTKASFSFESLTPAVRLVVGAQVGPDAKLGDIAIDDLLLMHCTEDEAKMYGLVQNQN